MRRIGLFLQAKGESCEDYMNPSVSTMMSVGVFRWFSVLPGVPVMPAIVTAFVEPIQKVMKCVSNYFSGNLDDSSHLGRSVECDDYLGQL